MRHLLSLSLIFSLVAVATTPDAFAVETKPAPPAKSATVPAKKPVAVRDKYAFLIGINRYKDPMLPPMKFAEKNVVDLARLLSDPAIGKFGAGHVVSITGGGASKAHFQESVDTWLLKKALPNDLIVVYACGHLADNPTTGETFLCLRDTDSTNPASGVPLVSFFKDLKARTQTGYIICLLDTSYGGTAPSGNEKTLKELGDLGISVITANGIGGQSYEDPVTQNSFFLQQLSEGMKSGGGQLPLKGVAGFIQENVAAQVQKQLQKTQKPTFTPAAHLADDQLPPINVEVKAGAQPIAFGHPVDQIGLTRPDLVMPRTVGNTVTFPPKNAPKNVAPEDDEDDDDGVDHALDMRPYMAKMKADIQKKWAPPKGLDNLKLVTVFTINRDGTITSPTIMQGSGKPEVDKSAMDALKAASPLDPLPKGAPRSIDIKYQFDWNITRGNPAGGN